MSEQMPKAASSANSLSHWTANDTFMAAYDEWIASPVTQRMLALAKMQCGPCGLGAAHRTAEKALYYSGGVDKAEEIFRLLSDFRDFANAVERVSQMQTELRPDYGAGALLKSGEPV